MLLGLFAVVRRTGILNSAAGRWLFELGYDGYKRLIEAGAIDRLGAHIGAGSIVIDVGANVGFFTTRFAAWVGPAGRVIAVEPEAVNFRRLRRRIEAAGLGARVETIQAAVCEQAGTVLLEINPDHPGDHKLGASGVPIQGVTIDLLAESAGERRVSLIKIDVQGAEMRVLAGARGVIERYRPVMFIEIDDAGLRRQGSSAAALFDTMGSFGYRAHRLEKHGPSAPLGADELAALSRPEAGYRDLLFLPDRA
jgi:FkbM family methyltransferase